MRARRRDTFRRVLSGISNMSGRIVGSQIFKSVATIVLIGGLATSSFYWGMWVERGRDRPAPQVSMDRREPLVTERSEGTPSTTTSKAQAPTAGAKPSGQAVSTVKPAPAAAKPATQAPAATKPATQAPAATKPATQAPAAVASTQSNDSSLKLGAAKPVTGEAVSQYDWVYSPAFGDWRFHTGIDLKVDTGTPVDRKSVV